MIAAGWRTTIQRIPGDAFVNFVGKNERLNVRRTRIFPRARIEGPHGAGTSAVISRRSMSADVELSTVIPLPESVSDRVNATEETVAACAHLPLHWAGRAARKSHQARTVVLRATIRHRRRGSGKIGADVAGVELDCVKSGIHIEPI